jgi:hypothetical protein
MFDSRTCVGFKRSGEPCKAIVEPPQTYCWWHDPANAEQRSISASKAARAKAGEIGDIKSELRQLVQDVLAGEVETRVAAVVGQLQGYRLRAVEIERKIKETEELEVRLESLEQAQQEGGRRWRA